MFKENVLEKFEIPNTKLKGVAYKLLIIMTNHPQILGLVGTFLYESNDLWIVLGISSGSSKQFLVSGWGLYFDTARSAGVSEQGQLRSARIPGKRHIRTG